METCDFCNTDLDFVTDDALAAAGVKLCKSCVRKRSKRRDDWIATQVAAESKAIELAMERDAANNPDPYEPE